MKKSRFAREFSAALQTSGANLSDLAKTCSRPSARLSAGILESWATGRAVPLGHAWIRAVERIETELNLGEGSLTGLLDAKTANIRPTGASQLLAAPAGEVPRNSEGSSKAHFSNLDDGIVWSNEAIRKTMEEELVVSGGLRTVEHRVTLTARRTRTANATLHVSCHFDRNSLPDESNIGVHDVEGAEVTDVAVQQDESGITKIVTLTLPSAAPGTAQQVAYSHRFDSERPVDSAIDRVFAWPLLYYSCTIRFDDDVPENLRLTLEASEDLDATTPGIEFVRPLTVDGNTASFRLEDPYGMRARVVWDSAETSSQP